MRDDHIGYLVNGEVRCLDCIPSDGVRLSRLYRINVEPYKQTCHVCNRTIVEGRTPAWCELFPKEA